MKYPLIEKWLGLEVHGGYVSAPDLEYKLSKGFEVYGDDSTSFSNCQLGNTHALAIGKQPIKKQTKEEAALELLEKIVKDPAYYQSLVSAEAKEILEMK